MKRARRDPKEDKYWERDVPTQTFEVTLINGKELWTAECEDAPFSVGDILVNGRKNNFVEAVDPVVTQRHADGLNMLRPKGELKLWRMVGLKTPTGQDAVVDYNDVKVEGGYNRYIHTFPKGMVLEKSEDETQISEVVLRSSRYTRLKEFIGRVIKNFFK